MTQDQKLSQFLRTHAPEAPQADAELEHLIMAGIVQDLPLRRKRPARWLWPVGGMLLAAACAAFYLAPPAAVVSSPASVATAAATGTADDDSSVEAFAADNWQVLVAGTDRESDMQKLMDEGVTVFD